MAQHAFSADVSLTLRLANRELPLAQVGPDFFIVQDDVGTFAPQDGMLIVKIDESIESTPIHILDPITGADCRTRYACLSAATVGSEG
jgi:hypothetical protein